MKLIDTVAIIGFLDPRDRLHKRSTEHLDGIAGHSADGTLVPTSSLIETDLLLKIMGYTESEREISWRAIEIKVANRIIANSVSSITGAVSLQKNGMDYFDSLITSLARETGSKVITTDKSIARIGQVEW